MRLLVPLTVLGSSTTFTMWTRPWMITRRRTIRGWQWTTVTVRVCAGTLTWTFLPWYVTVVQCAGIRTRMCFFEHRRALITRENATVATDGSRMLSVQFWTGDVARTPL